MMETVDSLEFRVLDVVVNAPSSVAGVYGDLVHVLGYSPTVLDALRGACDALERRQWVICRLMTAEGQFIQPTDDQRESCWSQYGGWLPGALREELAIDEVGLWYRLTDAGRQAWEAWSDESRHERWQLDDDAIAGRIMVTAESTEIAERALKAWLDAHPSYRVTQNQVAVGTGVPLRSGEVIERGVTVDYWYVIETEGEWCAVIAAGAGIACAELCRHAGSNPGDREVAEWCPFSEESARGLRTPSRSPRSGLQSPRRERGLQREAVSVTRRRCNREGGQEPERGLPGGCIALTSLKRPTRWPNSRCRGLHPDRRRSRRGQAAVPQYESVRARCTAERDGRRAALRSRGSRLVRGALVGQSLDQHRDRTARSGNIYAGHGSPSGAWKGSGEAAAEVRREERGKKTRRLRSQEHDQSERKICI